jgi:hypothetical protein
MRSGKHEVMNIFWWELGAISVVGLFVSYLVPLFLSDEWRRGRSGEVFVVGICLTTNSTSLSVFLNFTLTKQCLP